MKKDDQNSLKDIKAYFDTKDKPLEQAEFREFWETLNEQEKDELKNMKLN